MPQARSRAPHRPRLGERTRSGRAGRGTNARPSVSRILLLGRRIPIDHARSIALGRASAPVPGWETHRSRGSTDPRTLRHLGGVHGLQLCVAPIRVFQRCDADALTFEAEAEERHGWTEERSTSIEISPPEAGVLSVDLPSGSRIVPRSEEHTSEL